MDRAWTSIQASVPKRGSTKEDYVQRKTFQQNFTYRVSENSLKKSQLDKAITDSSSLVS
jgi:hypothetical protein